MFPVMLAFCSSLSNDHGNTSRDNETVGNDYTSPSSAGVPTRPATGHDEHIAVQRSAYNFKCAITGKGVNQVSPVCCDSSAPGHYGVTVNFWGGD